MTETVLPNDISIMVLPTVSKLAQLNGQGYDVVNYCHLILKLFALEFVDDVIHEVDNAYWWCQSLHTQSGFSLRSSPPCIIPK